MNKTQDILWILEDDHDHQFIFKELLQFSYKLVFFDRFIDLEKAFLSTKEPPSLLLLDIRLPDRNLIEAGQFILKSPYPFMVVSSVDQIDVMRRCYEAGCEDYLIKPFQKNELLLAVEKFTKRNQTFLQRSHGFPAKDIQVDQQKMQISRAKSGKIDLTVKEMQIFSLLYQNSGLPITREAIATALWGDSLVSEKALDDHLFNLRKNNKAFHLRVDCKAGSFSLIDEQT